LTVATFYYRLQPVDLEVVDRIGTNDHEFALACPICGTRGKLSRHRVSMDARGRVWIRPLLVCRNFSTCGWSVIVTNGRAKDAEVQERALA